jgi:hydroxypyruvate isomerase
MSSSLAFAPLAKPSPAASAGRLKQSAARWCYGKIPMDDLCRQAAELGLSGLDLVEEKDWPTCAKYGLVPAIVSGAGNIPVAWNRKENHEKLENDMRVNVAKAAAAKVPNVITFSGNRRGLADDEGRDNCILGTQARRQNRRGCRHHHLPGTAQQQSGPQGLPVRPHQSGASRWSRR